MGTRHKRQHHSGTQARTPTTRLASIRPIGRRASRPAHRVSRLEQTPRPWKEGYRGRVGIGRTRCRIRVEANAEARTEGKDIAFNKIRQILYGTSCGTVASSATTIAAGTSTKESSTRLIGGTVSRYRKERGIRGGVVVGILLGTVCRWSNDRVKMERVRGRVRGTARGDEVPGGQPS